MDTYSMVESLGVGLHYSWTNKLGVDFSFHTSYLLGGHNGRLEVNYLHKRNV